MAISPRIAWRTSLGLCLLVACGLAQAEETKTYPESGTQVFLGLDDTSAPTQVQDGRATEIQNVKLGISKDLRKRYGYSTVGNTLDVGQGTNGGVDEEECSVTGLYYTKFSSGTERIVSTCGNRFYYLNGTSWDTVTGTNVAITGGQNNQFVWTTALDEIIGTNNVNPPIRYDGTNLSVVSFSGLTTATGTVVGTVPTAAKVVAFFKNFLIFGNTTEGGIAYKTRVRWSNVGTTGTWSEADYVDIGALGGQEITAMAELYDNLYIFLTDSIYRVSFVAGADTFQVSKVTDDIGCVAKNSVQSITLTNAQNGLIFLDKDKKVYFFDGITVKDISQFITTTMNNLSASRLQYAVSSDTNTDYYLCVTNTTAQLNNLCLDMEYQIGEWTKHTTIPANAMAHVLDNNGKDQTYFGTNEAFVYQLENTSLVDDVGSASGLVVTVNTYDTSTASGQQVLYTTSANYVTGALVGAPIELTDGPGKGLTGTVSYNTVTGIVVTDAFSTTPTSTTSYQVGTITSTYTTKWYDMGQAARLKHIWEMYFWGASATNSNLEVSFATDFSPTISTQSISLASTDTDAVWGSAIWGSSLWGSGGDDIYRTVKLDAQGRFAKLQFVEDDPGEKEHLYGWSWVFGSGDIN